MARQMEPQLCGKSYGQMQQAPGFRHELQFANRAQACKSETFPHHIFIPTVIPRYIQGEVVKLC